jgi:sensor histidine kinase YesM
MALQPIVENAIRHGVGQRASLGMIRISARRVGDALHVTVRDDGPGFAATTGTAGLGLGLANTRARLRQLYGDRAELRTGAAPGGGAEVTLILPWHLPS